jgi:Ni,Fe-hydrogenase III large subunit
LANQSATAATQASRTIGLELERIAMHLATLTGLATDIAYLQPAGTYQRLRTAIINLSQRVCGNRFGKGWIRPGAATRITDILRADLLKTLRAVQVDFLQVNTLMRSSRSTQARFYGVGKVSTQAAQDLGLTGVVARASGVDWDLRRALPDGLYAAHPPQAIARKRGDCWARMSQRMLEAQASTEWLIDRVEDTHLDLMNAPDPFAPGDLAGHWQLAPNRLCVSLVEGARGPVMMALETDAAGQLIHVKVQDPSLANWFGLAYALRGQQISDFPICNKSFDLSYCGNDL